MPGRRNIARLITLLAGLFLGLVVVIVPSGHFIVSHQYIAGALETEIEINAQMIMQVISANPEMWEFEQARLQEYLSRRAAESQPEIRRVRNMQNEIIAEYATQLSPPVIMRSVPLFDAGKILRVYAPWDKGAVNANRATLCFRPFGQMGVTATFTFCDQRGSPAARAVIISQTGRPRVSDRSASNTALVCI